MLVERNSADNLRYCVSTEEKKQHKQQIYKCKTMSLQMQSARIRIKNVQRKET
jgi:hypothetical protein